MRILILSCGTRNKLVRFFKEAGNGIDRVVATDCSEYAPALYEADAYYLVPRMTEPGYLEEILAICRRENIDGVLPLFEDELTLLAENKALFEAEGICPIVSDKEAVELCRDKYAFTEYMKRQGIPVLPAWKGLEDFQTAFCRGEAAFPVFIKPVDGCGSVGAQKVTCMEVLQVLCAHSETEMLIQPFMDGEEYGADVYVDLVSHAPVAVFTKKKLRMRAGETEKAVSVRDEALWELILRTVKTLPLRGPVDMDLFCWKGNWYVSEINPRFGGGYPHAYNCGVDFTGMIGANLAKEPCRPQIGEYESGLVMLKFTDEVMVEL